MNAEERIKNLEQRFDKCQNDLAKLTAQCKEQAQQMNFFIVEARDSLCKLLGAQIVEGSKPDAGV